MAISGVVIVLSSDETVSGKALEVLAQDPRIELGERQQSRVPAVIDSGDEGPDSQSWEMLRSIPGVDEVHLAFASFEEEDPRT